MKRAARVATVLGLGVLAYVAAACEDTSPSVPCVNAPPGGCPADFGANVCDDPSCSSVYTCSAGRWVFDRACPPRAGGVDAGEAGTVQRDAGVRDASVDAPPGAFGGSGCVSLQPPDCPLGVALTCVAGGASCCGCEQLFVCADGGWNAWGLCADGGVAAR